jgi:hypothetical protein
LSEHYANDVLLADFMRAIGAGADVRDAEIVIARTGQLMAVEGCMQALRKQSTDNPQRSHSQLREITWSPQLPRRLLVQSRLAAMM